MKQGLKWRKEYKWIKINRRNKRDYARMILDKYSRNLISFDELYRHFWRLFRNPIKLEHSLKTIKDEKNEPERDYSAEGEAEMEARDKYEAEMEDQAEKERQAEYEANQPPPEEPPF